MDSWYHHESYYPDHRYLDSSGLYFDHRLFDQYWYDATYQTTLPEPTAMPPTQYPTIWDIRDSLYQAPPTVSPNPSFALTSSPTSEGGYSLVSDQSIETYPQPQPIHLSYTERAIQTSDPDNAGEKEGEEVPHVHHGPALRNLALQKTYKPARQQKELGVSQTIEFYVHGERGICLSDALEGIWTGFIGRDDRPLFENNRVQIMIRLHFVGCPSWQSKVFTTDHTTKRQPISRTKLAHEVAKVVGKFLKREKAKGHGDHSRCSWKDVSLRNMYLTRLVRVSAASWQPEIFVG